MPITVKVEPIDRDVQLLISDTLSPEAQSALLAQAAREQLAAADAQNQSATGETVPHRTYVDGGEGRDEDSVRPDGIIVYEFDVVAEMFSWIAAQLEEHSPVKSGRYQRSHTFYADGAEADPRNPPQGAQEFVFLSLVPYARKIEGAAKPPESSQAPEGVYEAVTLLARRRFGNTAKIRNEFRAATGGDLSQWASTPSAHRHARAHKRSARGAQEWLTRQPAIIITLR